MEHDAITEKIVVRYTAIAIKSNKPLVGIHFTQVNGWKMCL